jgi:hypothetical protein
MNTPYSFSKFFPLNVFQKTENHFVRDNTAFFKVDVDFSAKMPGKIS